MSKKRKDSDEASEQNKRTREQAAVCWSPEKVAKVSSEREFTVAERKTLDAIAGSLSDGWGYRAGPQGEHVRVEQALHERLYHVTNLTDGLFRNLEQYAFRNNRRPRESDLDDKFRAALQTPFDAETKEYNEVMLPFFEDEKLTDQMMVLASSPIRVTVGVRSRSFLMLILLARALVCLFLGDVATSKAHLASFERFLDE